MRVRLGEGVDQRRQGVARAGAHGLLQLFGKPGQRGRADRARGRHGGVRQVRERLAVAAGVRGAQLVGVLAAGFQETLDDAQVQVVAMEAAPARRIG